MNAPARLPATPYPMLWGTRDTKPWYANSENKEIGEVWFTASEAVNILVKLLFTAAKLSIQVHPNDAFARVHEGSPGKTEMWHVLRAEPGAQVAIGLKEPMSSSEVRRACESGEIVNLVNWQRAAAGDTFLIPAGTIHAIGENLTICEIQQVSNATYRIYDFERGRELHLDKAEQVWHPRPHEGRSLRTPAADGAELLAESDWFRTERLPVNGRVTLPPSGRNVLYVAVEGSGEIGGRPFRIGEAWEAPADSGALTVESSAAVLLRVTNPSTEPKQ